MSQFSHSLSHSPRARIRLTLLAIAAPALAAFAAASAQAAAPASGHACVFGIPLRPAACARFLSAGTRASGPSWLAKRATSGDELIYTSQPFAAAVEVSSLGPGGLTPAGTLALGQYSAPLGMTVDASKNLYVAISALAPPAVPSVAMFAPGATQPTKTYTSGLLGPLDVAVDRHGTLYVADVTQPLGGGCGVQTGGGTIVEYANGSMTPTSVIRDVPGCPDGVAVDANSNLYVSYVYYPPSGLLQSDVLKYAYQSTNGSHLNLTVNGGVEFGGLAVDSQGNLLVANVQDDATVGQLLKFAAGSKTPAATIEYGGAGWHPGFFALLGKRIFTQAYVSETVGTALAELDYPTGRQLRVQAPGSGPSVYQYGFAASP